MDPTTALAGSIGKILEAYGAAGAIGIIAGVVIWKLVAKLFDVQEERRKDLVAQLEKRQADAEAARVTADRQSAGVEAMMKAFETFMRERRV